MCHSSSSALAPSDVGLRLPEDPVTGSAHCSLGVLYSQRFGGPGTVLHATQGGSRRGAISATWDGKPERDGGRMKLRGRTFTSRSYLSVRGPMYSPMAPVAEGRMFV
jgi:predicted PhzF superfamily epimerase YddE/YHI9